MKEINRKPNTQEPLPRLSKVASAVAGVICGLAFGPLQAQINAPDLEWAPDPDADVITLKGNLKVTHDDNLLRENDNARSAIYADKGKGDTYLSGGLGIEFDRLISQQRLRAHADVEGHKYQDYDDFDNVGYNAGATLDWVVGRPLFGSAGLSLRRHQPTIQDRSVNSVTNPSGDRNHIDRQLFFFNAGFRMTPSWSLIGGIELDRSRNSLEVYKDTDFDQKAAEIGTRYAPGTGIEVDLVYRRADGDYKSGQRYDDNGVALLCSGSTCRENDYDQNEILTRVQYRPSEDSRLAGFLGYTRREYDQGDRDFSGVTTGFDVEWAYSGAVQMRLSLARSIEPDDEAATASYADTYSINFQPVIHATGKIVLSPYVRYHDRRYKGDQLAAGVAERHDKITYFGIEGEYEFRRNMALVLNAGHEKRSSNRENLDFKANVVGAGLQVKF
ncbi:MAG: outer membrane beta-barrel protein [Lautropia sp.]|nr:outer membrane beta-barrel protein [Lautropia sp.]